MSTINNINWNHSYEIGYSVQNAYMMRDNDFLAMPIENIISVDSVGVQDQIVKSAVDFPYPVYKYNALHKGAQVQAHHLSSISDAFDVDEGGINKLFVYCYIVNRLLYDVS